MIAIIATFWHKFFVVFVILRWSHILTFFREWGTTKRMMNHIIETGQSLLSSPYPTTFPLPFHPIRPLSAHYKPYKKRSNSHSLRESSFFMSKLFHIQTASTITPPTTSWEGECCADIHRRNEFHLNLFKFNVFWSLLSKLHLFSDIQNLILPFSW